jgi:hypothetical protein
MRILLDQGTPASLIPFLEGHAVTKAKDVGWDKLFNGELLKAAENGGFDMIVIVVLGNLQWRISQRFVRRRTVCVNAAKPGSYTEVEIPLR